MSDDSYIYEGDEAPRVFGARPAGIYQFLVDDFELPHKSEKGNWVLPVKLILMPDGNIIFDNPWTGVDKNGNKKDGIAEFLTAIDRLPEKGKAPDWGRVRNARGTCKLKVVIAEQGNLAGQEVNKVAWYILPKPGDLQPENRQQFPRSEVYPSGAKPTTTDDDPDDIPL
jgi:hypothetical protein